MSYSISVRGKTKDEAKTKALEALRDQLETQPGHAKDKEAIYANVATTVDAVTLEDGNDLVVEANGHAVSKWDGASYGDLLASNQTLKVYQAPAATV